MAQVPYTPYATAEPFQQGRGPTQQGLDLNVPEAAFGGTVARAIEGLGTTVQKVGSELFQRAMAIQDLNNETEAEQANLKLMDQAGDIHAAYNALQGEERVRAFPKYKQDLLDTQAKIRAGISNDMARRMYDRPSLGTIGRSIFNGAGAAASAQKEWVADTANATRDMAVKAIDGDPTDDDFFEQKVAEITAADQKYVQIKHGVGPDSPIANDMIMKDVSTATRARINAVARVDPPKARMMQEDALKQNRLTEGDNQFLDNVIKTQTRTIWGAGAANEIYQEGLKNNESLAVMEDKVRKRAVDLDPKDPLLPEHAVQTLRGVYNQDKYASRQEALGNIQTVDQAIISSGAKTEQELRSDPKVAATIDALPEKDRLALPGKINRYNAARDKITNRDNYVELYGMYKTNPIKFLDQDITKWQLSDGDMKGFAKLQQQVKERPQADPRVQQAIGWMRSKLGTEMRAAGVYSAPTKAEGAAAGSDWDKFTGELSTAIEQYVQDTGKVPKYKEITEEIGPQIMKTVSEPYLFGLLSSDVPYFKKTINQDEFDAFKKERTQQALDRGESAPTDPQLERLYRQMDYVRFYGKKKESK